MDDFMLGTHDLAQFLKQDRKSLHLELKEKNINPVIISYLIIGFWKLNFIIMYIN